MFASRGVLVCEPLQLEEKTQGLTDTADKLEDEGIAELVLDLAHHSLWKGEDTGWRYWVPRFVEGWQYKRTWTRSLLEVAEYFKAIFGKEAKKRLGQFGAVLAGVPDEEAVSRVLDDLKTLEKRGWCDGAELSSILLLKQGQLLQRQGRNQEALAVCTQVERMLPGEALTLKKDLANTFENIGWAFSLVNNQAVPSQEGKEALTRAVTLNPDNGAHLIALGVAQHGLKQYPEAVKNLLAGIKIEGEKNYSVNWLGNAYRDQKQYDEAIAAYKKAIELDPNDATPHNGLGNAYRDQKQYNEAIAAYKKAIAIDQNFIYAYGNLGDTYHVYAHTQLGNIYRELKQYDNALSAYAKVSELRPESAYSYTELGLTHALQKQIDNAHTAWQTALPLFEDDDWDTLHRALYTLALGKPETAFQQLDQILQTGVRPEAIDAVLIDVDVLSQSPLSPSGLGDFIAKLNTQKSVLDN